MVTSWQMLEEHWGKTIFRSTFTLVTCLCNQITDSYKHMHPGWHFGWLQFLAVIKEQFKTSQQIYCVYKWCVLPLFPEVDRDSKKLYLTCQPGNPTPVWELSHRPIQWSALPAAQPPLDRWQHVWHSHGDHLMILVFSSGGMWNHCHLEQQLLPTPPLFPSLSFCLQHMLCNHTINYPQPIQLCANTWSLQISHSTSFPKPRPLPNFSRVQCNNVSTGNTFTPLLSKQPRFMQEYSTEAELGTDTEQHNWQARTIGPGPPIKGPRGPIMPMGPRWKYSMS